MNAENPKKPGRDRFDPRFVPPYGADRPRLYIVGEAPGRSEVDQRRPIERTENGVRSRKPTARENRTYAGHLFDDIAETNPASLVAAGTSALAAFGINGALGDAREKAFALDGIPLRVTYHPHYLGRFGGEGSALWNAADTDIRTAWRARDRTATAPRHGELFTPLRGPRWVISAPKTVILGHRDEDLGSALSNRSKLDRKDRPLRRRSSGQARR